MRVLLVENVPALAHAVNLVLRAECNAVVDLVTNGQEAFELARRYDYDAIVLDLAVSHIDGFDVLRCLRVAGRHIPVLVLSGLDQPEVRVRALQAGADDVMAKPFDKNELCARLKAIVRRSRGYSQPDLQLGRLTLNLETHEVSVAGQPVRLTGKEYAILELLAVRRGSVITKEQFLSHLYGGMDEPEIKIIDVFICKLRKKLALVGVETMINTDWGRGYSLKVPSTVTEHRSEPSMAARTVHAVA